MRMLRAQCDSAVRNMEAVEAEQRAFDLDLLKKIESEVPLRQECVCGSQKAFFVRKRGLSKYLADIRQAFDILASNAYLFPPTCEDISGFAMNNVRLALMHLRQGTIWEYFQQQWSTFPSGPCVRE